MMIPGIPHIPNIPIPTQARREELHKAIWDYLRTGLSFDEANAVKHEAEAETEALLGKIIAGAKA